MASLSNRLADNKRFDFVSEGFDADKFAVVNLEGFEAISRPYRFSLILVSDDAGIDMDKMLQQPASLRIFAPDGSSTTPYHGVLAEFEQLHQAGGYVFYKAVLVPRLWRLSLYRISEVYLNEQNIPDIMEGILKASQLTSNDFQLKLTDTYRQRSFVCQYQETRLEFLSRWMEKEGMYYFFEQGEKAEKLIIADSHTMHSAKATSVNYRPADELDTGIAPDSVQDFICRQKPLPHQVILQEYNYRKASVELKVQAPVSTSGIGDVMLYGENFRTIDEGNHYAKLRAEEILCGGRVFSGAGTAVGLRSGEFMEMSHHYRPDFNGKYLVTEIQHQGSQAGALLAGIKNPYSGNETETIYHNSFSAISAAVQFRAERTTPKPRVAGTMNATIDAEGSGEYAELDEYGQYKVQLPFDQTDKSSNKGSARVRMATPYAGSDHGMNFPLHKNAEVLLSFIDGDPDQPVIVGAVPNSENHSLVNFNNPQENRISTAGGNQIYLGDSKGKEVMWLHSPFHNSSIGIGSIDPKGGGSLWQSTAGSSESITVGTTNSIFAGFKNSATGSVENSLSASISNKLSLGTSATFNYGRDITWKTGSSYTIDDSDPIALTKSNGLKGDDTVTIAAGLRTAQRVGVKAIKNNIRLVVGGSMAASALLATASAMAISGSANDKDEAKSTKTTKADGSFEYGGSIPPWATGGKINAARAISTAGALVSAGLINGVLSRAASALAEITKDNSAYSSNIEINETGIDIFTNDLLPPKESKIKLEKDQLALTSGDATSSSKILLQKDTLVLTGANAALKSKLELTSAIGKLATDNPAAVISLEHPAGSVVIDNSQITLSLAAGDSGLEIGPGQKISLGNFDSGVGISSGKITVVSSETKLELTAMSASLQQGNCTLKLSNGAATINGAFIKIA
ncbi:MAG: type VI secretion system tip protein TssI/VgrG [Herbaspirillum sp.]